MFTFLKDSLKPALPYLPDRLLIRILWARPHLIGSLPAGFVFRWPYYLGDVSMSIEVGNLIEQEMITGTYDADSARMIRRFVKPGDVCLDVGANVGAITTLLAKITGMAGHVFAFEPGLPYLDKLRANLEFNPALASIVTIVNMGLSNQSGTLFWMADPDHPFNAVLSVSAGIPVSVTTIDAYVREHGFEKVDFIKIDVESMELEVLKGSREALARFHPVVLFETMEWAREARGFDIFKEIEEFLHSVGYGMYDLSREGALLEVSARCLPPNTLAIPRRLAGNDTSAH